MTSQVQEEQQNSEMGYFKPGELVVTVRHRSNIVPEELIERLRAALQFTQSWRPDGMKGSLLLRKLQASYGFDHGVYQTALRASNLLQETDLELLQQAVEYLTTDDIVTFPAGPNRRGQLSLAFLQVNEGNIYDYSEVLVFLAAELTLRQQELLRERPEIGIEGLSPGWRFSGAPGGNLISGGPGAEPVPPDGQVDAADAEMKLTALPGPGSGARMAEAARERLGRKLQKNGGCLEEVDVYVLDTIPSCEHLQTAYQQWGQNGSNEWIASLLAGLEPCYEGRDELHSNHLHLYYTEQDQEIEIKDHEYYMADHGFFIAGLIHALAPTVPIYLFKVLNNHGAGAMRTLAWGLQKCLSIIQERERPAVINCSLTLGVDFDCDGDDDTLESFIAAAHHWLISPLNEMFADLDNVALVVAAAGNDSKAGKQKVLTRFPAAYQQVVGVGALQRDFTPTGYTNVPDNPQWQGFVVFGGELDPGSSTTASATNGILSVYSAPHFPDGHANEYGWARWAGTSFATPLVTGLLAQLLCTDMSRDEALALLRAAVSENDPNHPHILTLQQGV